MKLFKNNKYKDGTINEKLEQIKRERESNSKPKGTKVRIDYENFVKIEDTNNNNNKEGNQKHKYQFKKKENA